MNIKNIFFLSFIPLININAIQIDQKIKQTHAEYIKCRQSRNGWFSTKQPNCDQQEKAFNDAKKEFLTPFIKLEKEGQEAHDQLIQSKNWFFGISEEQQSQLERKKALSYAASMIKESIIGPLDLPSLHFHGPENIIEFCEDVLKRFYSIQLGRSDATRKMGAYQIRWDNTKREGQFGEFIISKQEGKDIVNTLKEIIKKQAAQESSQK